MSKVKINKKEAYDIRKCIETAAQLLPAGEGAKYWFLFPKFDFELKYKKGNRCQYEGKLYQCLKTCSSVKPDNTSYWEVLS